MALFDVLPAGTAEAPSNFSSVVVVLNIANSQFFPAVLLKISPLLAPNFKVRERARRVRRSDIADTGDISCKITNL